MANVTTSVRTTEEHFIRAALQHPRQGLTVDDLGNLWKAAIEAGIPGDAHVKSDISYGEGSYRGGLSISHKVELTDAPPAEVQD